MAKKEKKKKEPKRKPKYGLFSCVGYIYKLMWEYERSLTFTAVLTVPVSLILSAIGLYTSPAILRVLETSDTFSYIALVIVGLLGAKLVFDLAQNVIRQKINLSEGQIDMFLMYRLSVARRDFDWYLEYDPEVHIKKMRADESWKGAHLHRHFSDILVSLLEFLLFGTVVTMLHPMFFLLIAGECAVDFAVRSWKRKRVWRDRDTLNEVDKKLDYMNHTFGANPRYAKDVRLYRMKKPLHDLMESLNAQRLGVMKKYNLWDAESAVLSFLAVLIRDGAAYAYLIYCAVNRDLSASDFVLYFTAITSLSTMLTDIIGSWGSVSEAALAVSDTREYLEIKGKLNRGEGIPIPRAPFSIEFRNVSYQYPEGEEKVLDGISFRIEAGERIALVGLNGAGKTTLTMLMCGMILPDEGEVLLDDHTPMEYNRDEMYTLFGLVPQNYHVLPVSIARNVACTLEEEEIDRERLDDCLERAGLSEKIHSLPEGADTPLNKAVNKNGVELSGGEMQKLLLARLVYKAPLCMILDEPTSALDPIAEDRMYRQYNEIADSATSVFISHRLASTRFCDRIFLLDHARIAETGSHEELMAMGGKYKELFDIQSKYYREGAENDETKQ